MNNNMNPSDLEQILKAIKKHDENMPTQKSMLENFLKLLTSLSSVGVIWLVGTVVDLRQSIYGLEIKMDKLEEFANEPRFTLEDYASKTQPIIQTLNIHNTELDKLERRLNEYEKTKESKHSEMDLKLQHLNSELNRILDK